MNLSDTAPPPKTLDQAVQRLLRTLTPEDQHYIENSEPEEAHFGLGMLLRNLWVHPPGSPLRDYFITTHGLGHPDDISAIVLAALWAGARGQEFDVARAVQSHKDFWATQGCDPVTGELIATAHPEVSWVKRYFGRWAR